MSVEREAKLEVPPGFRLPTEFPEGVTARPAQPQRYITVYLDTPDLRLVRWGCSLRHREGEGWTLKLPVESRSDLLARTELIFEGDPRHLPGEARELVAGLTRTAFLSPVARLRTLRWKVELETGAGAPLATLTDDEVSVMDGSRVASRFRELEVELAPGAPPEVIGPIVATLRLAGAGPVGNVPKLVRALGSRAREPEIVMPPVGPDATIRDVVRHALAMSVVRLFSHDPGVRLGADPEDIHQARVATRRLRSDLRSFWAELDPEWVAPLRDELRWLGGELGAVRDAEVLRDRLRKQAESLPDRDLRGAARLVGRLERQRAEARAHLLAAMHEPRYPALLDRLVEAARAPIVLEDVAQLPAVQTLQPVLQAPWSHLRTAIARVLETPSNQALHAARIRAKRVRYAAEALAPVFGDPATAFAEAAAGLQDLLGEHQDAVVASAWLRTAAASAGSATAFVAGELAAIEARAAAAARLAWPAAWKALAAKRMRFWK